mmetsp:Transcript_1186/g.2536  ORF Transcript_1186/g.2536 Transcript_1186/m.2536 type:complete len:624 (+) Transcript_1186:637-2508(+)
MASPFSFHCIICFEEFDTDARFPVVLPCGHTYVCNECANRLDKCMECRTPLYEIIPQTNAPEQLPGWSTRSLGANNSRNASNHHHHHHHHRQQQTKKPAPQVKRRLPLPKNVVLMSLIEATELATENVQGQEHEPSLHESPMIKPSVLDLEADEEEKIRYGTSLAISDCGTYAVAAKDGLEIFPNRPESLVQHSEEDVDTLVRFYNRDMMGGGSVRGSVSRDADADGDGDGVSDDKKTAEGDLPRKENTPPGRLSWGDRVQIVSTQNGWAKMARGYGYVRAGAQQLVKVGGSVDRSCKLEAMLRLMSSRRRELREEQKKIDNQFIAFMNELQVSLMSDEDLTVIAADTFHKNLENNDPSAGGASTSTATVRTRNEDVSPLDTNTNANAPEPVRTSNTNTYVEPPEAVRPNNTYEDSTPLKPRFNERPSTPPGAASRGSFFCSSSDVLNAFVPLATSESQPPALPSVTSTPAIAREFNNMSIQQRNQFQQQNFPQTPRNDRRSNAYVEDTPTRILTTADHPSPSALRAGARAWREMHGRPASNGIDFRTGMSGHSALFSSSAHPHDYLASTQRFFAGMSNHTGLTMWKAPKFPFSLTSSNTTDDETHAEAPSNLAFPSPGDSSM